MSAKKKKSIINSVIKSLVIAIIIFAISYHAFQGVWNSLSVKANTTDFCYYRVITIGEILCISLFFFSTCCFFLLHKKESSSITNKDKYLPIVFAIAGLISGLFIPKPQFFLQAGQGCSAFLVLLFCLGGLSFSKMLLARKYSNFDKKGIDHILVFLATFCVAFYLMLYSHALFYDIYPEIMIIGCSGLFTIIMMSIAILASKKDGWQLLVLFILTATITAFGMTYFVLYRTDEYAIYPIIMFYLSFSYYKNDGTKNWITLGGFLEQLILISIPTLIFNFSFLSLLRSYLLSQRIVIIVALLIICAELINGICIFKIRRNRSLRTCFSAFKNSVMFQSVIIIAILTIRNFLDKSEVDIIFDCVLSVYIIRGIFGDIYSAFNDFMKAEDEVESVKNDKTIPESEKDKLEKTLKYKRLFTYTKIILLCCGTALFLLFAPAGFIEVQNVIFRVLIEQGRLKSITLSALLIVLVGILLIIGFFINSKVIKKKNRNHWVISLIIACLYLFTGYLLFQLNYPYKIQLNPIRICAVFQIIGCAALVGESFYSNIYRIRITENRREYIVDSFIIFFGSIITLIFTIMPTDGVTFGIAKGTLNISYFIISVVCNTWALALLPTILFTIIKPRYHFENDKAIGRIPGEIAKNGFLAVVIAFVAGSMPIMIYFVNENFYKTIVGIGISVLPIYEGVKYCTSNNVIHLLKRENDYWENKKELNPKELGYAGRRITGMEEHLRCQNLCALFSLLLYCLIPIFNPFKSSDKSFIEEFKETYYPTLKNDWGTKRNKNFFDKVWDNIFKFFDKCGLTEE